MSTTATNNGTGRKTKAAYEAAAEKPPTLPVNFGGIPAELKALPQWVCWRWYRKFDKKTRKRSWSKLPVDPRTTEAAESNNPTTWGTFEEAWGRYDRKRDRYDGIGFMFSEADPYAGVDVDDCRDPDTGAVDAWGDELLTHLGGYTEVSPTGTGVKAIVRGRKLGKRCKAPCGGGEVEMYDHARFWTMTGAALRGSPSVIPERQEALDALYPRLFPERPGGPGRQWSARQAGASFAGTAPPKRSAVWEKPFDKLTDDDILQLASEAKNGPKFRALWGGDTGGHNGDDSRADAALCSILTYWCRKDAKRIDRLFRRSALLRDKWDEVHSGEGKTYGEMTVSFAVGECTSVYPGPRRKKRRKGKRKAGQPTAGGDQGGEAEAPQDTVAIIRAFWFQEYDFIFKRGKDLYSAKEGGPVPRSEVCDAPCSELVELLLEATDAPADDEDLHKHFSKWAKTAYKDELRERPPEEATGEVMPLAMEQFRLLVRGALRTVVSLGENYPGNKEGASKTEVQKKPLIEFVRAFAQHNADKWGSVRGMSIWSRLKDGRIQVALRVELFQELRCCPDLAKLTYDKFADLCVLYAVGERCRVKGGLARAILLNDEFHERMVASPEDEPPDRQTAIFPRARARKALKRLGRRKVMNRQRFKHDASHDAAPRQCPETAPIAWGERLGGSQTLPPDARARTPARARVRRAWA
jgi:primase-polymerase (primpol)-like protein